MWIHRAGIGNLVFVFEVQAFDVLYPLLVGVVSFSCLAQAVPDE